MNLYFYSENKDKYLTSDKKLLGKKELGEEYAYIDGIYYNIKTTDNLIFVSGLGYRINNNNKYIKLTGSRNKYVNRWDAKYLIEEGGSLRVFAGIGDLDAYSRKKFNTPAKFLPYGKHGSNNGFIDSKLNLPKPDEMAPPYYICFENSSAAEKLGFIYSTNRSWGFMRDKKAAEDYEKAMIHDLGYIPPLLGIRNTKYNPENKNKISKNDILAGVASPTFLISEGLNYKFGVEIETNGGYIPEFIYREKSLNLESTRDGSITGGEYVTGVLQGDAGFNQLYRTCREIQKRCTIDKTCGIHVHIGNTLLNKYFAVYSYILGEKLQTDIFSIMPNSRKNNMYCSYLPKLQLDKYIKDFGHEAGMDFAYDDLYEKLSVGRKLSSQVNKSRPHPGGRYCGRYQGVEMDKILRYCWLNLIPSHFNTRKFNFPVKKNGRIKNGVPLEDTSYTIEFRNHSASMNYEKIKNWVLICMAFVYYVNNKKRDILEKETITLEDLVVSAYNKQSKPLLKYIKNRRKLFDNSSSKAEKVKVEEEEYNDKFEYSDSIKFKELICV